jgi:formylglycine-generating enzyme required for sulfatase activity
MDRYEVTNQQFKVFVDAGGYTNTSYWNYPIYVDGKEIPLVKALSLFLDGQEGRGRKLGSRNLPDGQGKSSCDRCVMV